MMPRSVLLVEDDHEFRNAMQELLAEEGYVVYACNNGSEALAYLASERSTPDVIMVDLMMPSMDGWEFLRRIRTSPAWSAIPSIVISAVSDGAMGDIEGVQIIKKPVNLDSLLATLDRAVQRMP